MGTVFKILDAQQSEILPYFHENLSQHLLSLLDCYKKNVESIVLPDIL